MLKKILKTLLVVTLSLGTFASNCGLVFAAEKQELSIAVVTTDADNDLYVTLNNNYKGIQLVSTLDAALALNEDANSTNDVTGIMVLADNYPNTTTVISAEQAAKIETLGVRLYVEYPANNDTLGITGYSGTVLMNGYENNTREYNRGIITNATAMGMVNHSLLYVNGARLSKKSLTPSSIDSNTYWMVASRVAGYDVAEYGITEATYSLIEVVDNVMIASTKFSQFISARYAPYGRYQEFWKSILSWLSGTTVSSIEWTPLMTTSFGPTDSVDTDDYINAVIMNTEWYIDSGMVLSETDHEVYVNNKSSVIEDDETGENNLTNNGTGIYGILEAFSSGWGFNEDGSQKVRFVRRADCNGESAGNLALAGLLVGGEQGKEYSDIAYNVVNWLLTESILSQGNRANPDSPEYGLLSWDDRMQVTIDAYYGDDNAKAILGLITATSALRTTGNYDEEQLDAFDERILEAILANYRTTSTTGMREARINGPDLRSHGWEYYFNGSVTHYAPHFQALNMATYIWAYDRTGYAPLLDRAKTGITNLMKSYEKTMEANSGTAGEWNWTNGLQQERAKMILPVAWLARVEPTEQHLEWLDTLITDMMMYQDATTGALQDRVGETGQGNGTYGSHPNNAAYGRHEAPVIQNNGDPCIDALYTSSFAMMSLNESVAAMDAVGNTALKNKFASYSDKLADFFVKCQTTSTDEDYNGVWFRGFDYEKWEVYGSDGDAAWGVWATETGWSQAWISTGLSMKVLDTNIWDSTKTTAVNKFFEDTATLMLAGVYDKNDLVETIEVTPLGRGNKDVLTDKVYGSTNHDDGKWIGTETQDITITIDYTEEKTFTGAAVGFLSNMASGICPAGSVTYYVSEDGTTYEEVGKITIVENPQALYDANEAAKVIRPVCDFGKEVSARYIKIVVKNPGNYLRTGHENKTNTWVFIDEVELVVSKATKADLYEMLKITRPLQVALYSAETGKALDDARKAAEEVYAKTNPTANEITEAYNDLKEACNNLKQKMEVESWTPASRGDNKDRLIDSIFAPNTADTDVEYLAWQNATTFEVVLDMFEVTAINSVGYSVNSKPRAGIYTPNAKIYVSNNLSNWQEVGYIDAEPHPKAVDVAYASKNYLAMEGISARYVKFVFENDDDHLMDGWRNEWIFMDEVMVNVDESEIVAAYRVKLQSYYNEVVGTVVTPYTAASVEKFEQALQAAKTALENTNAIAANLTTAYTALVTAHDGLELAYSLDPSIIKNVTYNKTPNRNASASWNTLTNGVFGNGTTHEELAYIGWSNQDNVEVVVEFKNRQFLTGVGYSGLSRANFGIYMPDATFYLSKDGTTWTQVGTVQPSAPKGGVGTFAKESELIVFDSIVEAKYIKAVFNRDTQYVQNGGSASEWIFLDEITFTLGNLVKDVTYNTTPSRNATAKWDTLVNNVRGNATTHEELAYVGWADKDNVEVILEFKERQYFTSLGYSGLSRSNYGIYKPDATFYVSDDKTNWTKVGTINPSAPSGAYGAFAAEEETLTLDSIKVGKYVKVVLNRDSDQVQSGWTRSEWIFLDEITYEVTTPFEDGSINTTPSRNAAAGWEVLVDGLYGEARTHEELAYIGWADKDNVEVVIELASEMGIEALGYSGLTNPRMGVYRPDAELYLSLDGTNWRKVGSIQPTGYQSAYDENVLYNYETAIELAQLSGVINAKYVKVVFSRDTDNVKANYKRSEWYFIDEIEIRTTNSVVVDKSELTTALNETTALLENATDYTATSAAQLEEVYKAAKEIAESDLVSQKDVDDAVKALEDAEAALVQKGNTEELEEALESVEEMDLEEYTEGSVDALEEAIEKAKEVMADENATQEMVDEALANVNAAKDALVSITELEEEIANAEEKGTYTDETYAAYEEALADAQEILENPNATKEEVEAAINEIKEAYEALRFDYQIIEGANSQWTKGNSDLAIKANGEFVSFVRVLVNGSELAERHYTAHEGSTIITFKESYLKSLAAGTYEVTVEFEKGVAKTTFTIKAPVPGTADESNSTGWMIGLLSSLIAGLGFFVVRRRYNRG